MQPLEYAIPKVHRSWKAKGSATSSLSWPARGVRSAYDLEKAIALGADGCIIGPAELGGHGLHLGWGAASRDWAARSASPPLTRSEASCWMREIAWKQIVNLYTSWAKAAGGDFEGAGDEELRELRGKTEVLVYLE